MALSSPSAGVAARQPGEAGPGPYRAAGPASLGQGDQQGLCLVQQMLAALHQAPASLVPQREAFGGFVGAGVATRSLEGHREIGVGLELLGDLHRIDRVGFGLRPASVPLVGSVGPHVSYVVASPDQVDGSVASEAGSALDPHPAHRPQIHQEGLHGPVPVARDPKAGRAQTLPRWSSTDAVRMWLWRSMPTSLPSGETTVTGAEASFACWPLEPRRVRFAEPSVVGLADESAPAANLVPTMLHSAVLPPLFLLAACGKWGVEAHGQIHVENLTLL